VRARGIRDRAEPFFTDAWRRRRRGGGGGFYGYNPEYKAFVQAVSYRYVPKDARLRNEAFFKQLKI
jgi:hypothetical protein